MGEIKVVIEEFKSAAKQFSSASTDTETIQKSIKTASDALLQTWKGKGKDAFDHEYQLVCKKMDTYSKILMDISKELDTIREQFEAQDLSSSNQISKGANN